MTRFLLPLFLLAPAALIPAHAQTRVTSAPFGDLPSGQHVTAYTLTDPTLTVKLITYGAHTTSIDAPGRDGKKADVVLGYPTLAGYLADTKSYMGAIVGRYGNRIAHAEFQLDGHDYKLTPNENGNQLHGGPAGFNSLNWTGKVIPSGVEFTLISPDGDQGYPGTLTAHVRYTLTGKRLRVDYTATTDKPTVVNLTQHSYFNMAGAGSGDILGEQLTLNASRYTPVSPSLIPTGQLPPVAGTPFDFTHPTPVGQHIHDQDPQLAIGHGFDHNFLLDHPGLANPAAVLTDPVSGRTLTVYTTEPAVQFYAGQGLDGSLHGIDGRAFPRFGGLALETQHYPDSPNHPAFPSTTLNPGQTYKTTTIFEFTTK